MPNRTQETEDTVAYFDRDQKRRRVIRGRADFTTDPTFILVNRRTGVIKIPRDCLLPLFAPAPKPSDRTAKA